MSDLIQSCHFTLKFFKTLLHLVVLGGVELVGVLLRKPELLYSDIHLFICSLVDSCTCSRSYLFIDEQIGQVDVKIEPLAKLVNQELVRQVLSISTLLHLLINSFTCTWRVGFPRDIKLLLLMNLQLFHQLFIYLSELIHLRVELLLFALLRLLFNLLAHQLTPLFFYPLLLGKSYLLNILAFTHNVQLLLL